LLAEPVFLWIYSRPVIGWHVWPAAALVVAFLRRRSDSIDEVSLIQHWLRP